MSNYSQTANFWIKELPVYEPGRPIGEVARELGFETEDWIVKLASNENALGPSPRAVEAMCESALQMHRYPDGGGYYLKRALAEKLAVDEREIVLLNGSNEGLEFIGHVFLGEGRSVVLSERAFVVYKMVAAAERAEALEVPMRGFTHDLDAMADAIRDDTSVVVIGNPNNPTGTMVDNAAIERFMARVPDRVVVCFDEAYTELMPEEQQPDVIRYIKEGRNVVVLRTFSKAYGLAGLRIGYAVASAECTALFNKVRQPFNVNSMAQAAALAALDDDEYLAATREMIIQGRKMIEDGLTAMGLEFVPSVTNFMLVKVGDGRGCFNALQKEGVIVRPLECYALPEYIRVTIGVKQENERFLAALKKVSGK